MHNILYECLSQSFLTSPLVGARGAIERHRLVATCRPTGRRTSATLAAGVIIRAGRRPVFFEELLVMMERYHGPGSSSGGEIAAIVCSINISTMQSCVTRGGGRRAQCRPHVTDPHVLIFPFQSTTPPLGLEINQKNPDK